LLTEDKSQAGDKGVTLLAFTRAVADLHAAGDRFDQHGSEAELKKVHEAFAAIEKLYPEEVLAAARALASRYRCPMHPDVTGAKGDLCRKCGMPLDSQVRLSPFTLPEGARPATIVKASIHTDAPLTPGTKVTARLHLNNRTGEPIVPTDLREVHTQKIHLLIVDGSLTDYHHEHPQPTGLPGEYAFSFTPQRPGPYRAWADVQPYMTGIQEYARADISAPSKSEPVTDTTQRLTAKADGLRYELHFASAPKVNQPVTGELRVTGADGKPCTQLEPTMAAFAHLVAFHSDGVTVLHIHPQGTRVLTSTDRGGPVLTFQFYAPKPGFYRLFSQVQLGGAQKFAPFGIQVAP
jgi:hypothetical protein